MLQQIIRQCLAYRKEDRLDVIQLARTEYLQPPIPKHLRQAVAAASQQQTGSASSGQQPSTPTGTSPSSNYITCSASAMNLNLTKLGVFFNEKEYLELDDVMVDFIYREQSRFSANPVFRNERI
jgi:hypothetical protein